MEEPGGLQSVGSLRVEHDWATSLSCIGEGNGNPLQCSCLENPRDGGAWWAAIYGVAQSQTRLKWLSSSSSSSSSIMTACQEGSAQSLKDPDSWSWQSWRQLVTVPRKGLQSFIPLIKCSGPETMLLSLVRASLRLTQPHKEAQKGGLYLKGERTPGLPSCLLTSYQIRPYSAFSSSPKLSHHCAFVHETDFFIVQNVLLGCF